MTARTNDSKNKRQQEQTTARTNDSKNKRQQEQTTARTNNGKNKHATAKTTTTAADNVGRIMSAVRMNGVGVA
jgi:hypothetical protein